MTKTVKEQEMYKVIQTYTNDEQLMVAFNELLEEHKNEIDEKNEYINFLENRPGNHDCKHCPNKEKLFKEDFADYEIDCQCKSEDCDFPGVNLKYLKDNSKYDKLESKECD